MFRFGEHGRAETSGSESIERWRTGPPNAWRRFWARTFDTAVNWAVGGSLFALAVPERSFGYFDSMEQEPTLVFVLASFFLVTWVTTPITNALSCGLTGFTLGKFLFGLKVVGRTGQPIGVGQSLLREYRVLASGLGLHLLWPFVPMQRLAISEKLLDRHGTLPWDAYKNVVLYRTRRTSEGP